MFKKSLFLAAILAAFIPAACSSASSGLNQTCSNSGDCKDGLLCIQQECQQNEFPVSVVAKECIQVECSTDVDCCDPADFDTAACTDYKAACDADPLAFECGYYESECVCHEVCDTKLSECVPKEVTCTTDDDCNGNGNGNRNICDTVTSKCVECLVAADDCGTDQVCTKGECIEGCKSDEECPSWYICDAETKACVHKGCNAGEDADNRDCILATGHADSVCVAGAAEDGKPECQTPCQENVDCNTNGVTGHVCTDGKCEFLGCNTDSECLAYFKGTNYDGGTTDIQAKCVAIAETK